MPSVQTPSEHGPRQESGLGSVATTTADSQRVVSGSPASPFVRVQTANSSAFDGFSPHQQTSDAASMSQQDTAKVCNSQAAVLYVSLAVLKVAAVHRATSRLYVAYALGTVLYVNTHAAVLNLNIRVATKTITKKTRKSY